MTTIQPKPEATADTLSSRILVATFGMNRGETNAPTKVAILNWLRDTAALAGMTFEQREGGDLYFTLSGFGVVLGDWISTNDPVFNLTATYPKGPNGDVPTLYGGVGNNKLPKPDLRLTAGMTPTKAAQAIKTGLKTFLSYQAAVVAKNVENQTTLDLHQSQIERMIAVGPTSHYYKPDPKTDATRNANFYPEKGSGGTINVSIWDTARIEMSSVPLPLAEAILALVKNYQPAA